MYHAWDVIIRLRPTIFVAAVAILALSLPSQMIELYIIDIERWLETFPTLTDPALDDPAFADQRMPWLLAVAESARFILIAMAAGLLAMLILWLGSLHLVSLDRGLEEATRRNVILAKILVILIPLAPIVGVLLGLMSARIAVRRIETAFEPPTVDVIWATVWVLVFAAAAFALATFLGADWAKRQAARLFSRTGAAIGVLIILLFTAGIILSPVTLPQALGTQGVVFLFFATLAFVLTFFSRVYRMTGYPTTVLMVAAAFIFSVLGLNDNHKVDYALGLAPAVSLEKGFQEWYDIRADRNYFDERKKPYPVYIVAAEGGGMYAAYHLASFLARVQDNCAHFAQHMFAISSVSGGSLGAAVFTALAQELLEGQTGHFGKQRCAESLRPMRTGEMSGRVGGYFTADFLSPLVAATLFPDMLQRLIPYPVRTLDRARALEAAFAAAWKGDRNPFDRPLRELASGPALFLNTTSIETGSRVTISNLHFERMPTTVHLATQLCHKTPKSIEISVGAAVSLSARFPWLTPTGWLEKGFSSECDDSPIGERAADGPARNRLYLADGGYFENSGLETALELAGRLRAYARSNPEKFPHGVDIKVISVFAMDEYMKRYWDAYADLSASTPGEIFAPIKTLLNTRVARARAIHRKEIEFDDAFQPVSQDRLRASGRYVIPKSSIPFGVDHMHQKMLEGGSFFLPLGWRLSNHSKRKIWLAEGSTGRVTYELIRRELEGEDTESYKAQLKASE
jgi:hypothetical protein